MELDIRTLGSASHLCGALATTDYHRQQRCGFLLQSPISELGREPTNQLAVVVELSSYHAVAHMEPGPKAREALREGFGEAF